MIAIFSLIADTLWEFWQYLKPNGKVYLAGKPYKNGYILISMIPENVNMPDGWEKLTNVMTRNQASQRADHFKLIKLVEPRNSPQIGT